MAFHTERVRQRKSNEAVGRMADRHREPDGFLGGVRVPQVSLDVDDLGTRNQVVSTSSGARVEATPRCVAMVRSPSGVTRTNDRPVAVSSRSSLSASGSKEAAGGAARSFRDPLRSIGSRAPRPGRTCRGRKPRPARHRRPYLCNPPCPLELRLRQSCWPPNPLTPRSCSASRQ